MPKLPPEHHQQDHQHDHYKGHRERLRQRIFDKGAASLQDYELLEALLFHVNARGDTKPLAKDLLKSFGHFRAIIQADPAALKAVKGVGTQSIVFFELIRELSLRMSHHAAFQEQVLASWNDVITFCRESIGYERTERFMVLYLDSKNKLIRADEPHKGTVDRVMVYPREIVKTATQQNTASVILVHNHPSDHTEPSKADIDMTKSIVSALQSVQITVHDHIIIGPSTFTSFKSLGLL